MSSVENYIKSFFVWNVIYIMGIEGYDPEIDIIDKLTIRYFRKLMILLKDLTISTTPECIAIRVQEEKNVNLGMNL